jgi:uncharacterized protein (TIGR02466 family)
MSRAFAPLSFCLRALLADYQRKFPSMPDELIPLFPTPVLRSRGLLESRLVEALIAHFTALATDPNKSSGALAHTRILQPGESPLFIEAAARITPKLADFGLHLFGERLTWMLKEMWVNVLDTGGHQSVHNHANSFISGVLYLTATPPGSQTVFMKGLGGTDFKFKNDHARVESGPYNSDKWISPTPAPGDMILFPSYLLHSVPPNPGERRITLAFNAIPAQLDSWGYLVRFSG